MLAACAVAGANATRHAISVHRVITARECVRVPRNERLGFDRIAASFHARALPPFTGQAMEEYFVNRILTDRE